jgi:hypothetical protein
MNNWITDKIDVLIARAMIWSLRRAYGADCEVSDLIEFADTPDVARCPSCRAGEIIEFLEEHIKLIEE